jgi:hypothetical protein
VDIAFALVPQFRVGQCAGQPEAVPAARTVCRTAERLSEELDFWLCETHGWPCSCLNKGGCVEAFQCDACLIHGNLCVASEAYREGRWGAAYRAVKRAADRDGRLDALRDGLENFAFAPYEEMEVAASGGGSSVVEDASARRLQDPEVRYSCGLTYAEHRDIALDVIRRECEFVVHDPQHNAEYGVHLGMGSHPACGSTFCWPLRGHRTDFDCDEPTRP